MIRRFFISLLLLVLVVPGCGGGGGGDSGSGGSSSGGGSGGGGGTGTGGGGGGGSGGGFGSSGGSGGIAGVALGTPSFGIHFSSAAATSQYDIYVPPTYTGAPIGLVVAFHGVEGTTTPDGWFQVCVDYANKDRFIVVAPYGNTSDGGSGAWDQPYARQIMGLVRSRYNVDNAKQYMTAISGGCYPGIWFALASAPPTYVDFMGETVQSGFQSDFAAVGFSSPAYSPNDGNFGSMVSQNAAALGFTPALWVDYGQLSSDGGRATDLANWATSNGYNPVNNEMRPGEGHAPDPPYSFVTGMFDMFAAHPK